MSKQIFSQRYIIKVNSSRFEDCKLNLGLQAAKKNEELISLGDSQMLRFVRAIKNNVNSYSIQDLLKHEEEIQYIKKQIKNLKKGEVNNKNKKLISQKYDELYEKLFIEDIISIVFDSKRDFDKFTSKDGILFNNKRFKRLVGTTGGIKSNTILFCSENVFEELNKKLDNGRNIKTPLIPAKFEAYKALACSSSTPVTQPRILIIKDGTVEITDDNVILATSEDGDLKVKYNQKYTTNKDFCDGCGIASVDYIKQVAIDMGEFHIDEFGNKVANYISSGVNTRYAFEKGMICTFDINKFATEVVGDYKVKDFWGTERDIRDYDVILTNNMMKLCSAYNSLEEYIENCNNNGYLFSVTKLCPSIDQLEIKRDMNYQYLQSYEFTDEDINELTSETVNMIKGALGEDYAKSILFLKGNHITDSNLKKSDYDFIRALCIDKRMINDPFVKQKIKHMIDKRMNDAKKGRVQVDANYQIICGDLYALAQSMFGLEITGLLKKGEFYSKAWSEKGEKEIVAFRSPMTSKNNIRRLDLKYTNEVKEWFKYLETIIVLNAWDTTTDAMNGAD